MVIVFTLVIVPHTSEAFIVNEPCNIDTHVSSAREAQDMFVFCREAVIDPFLNE